MRSIRGFFAKAGIHIVLIILCVSTIIPFCMAIVVSFSDEKSLMRKGFSFRPDKFSIYAYQFIFTGSSIFNSYKISIFVTVIGTVVSLLICSMLGYIISVERVKYRNVIAFLVFIPMIFYPGLVPWYLICTRTLHLKNTMFALILPLLVSPFNIFLLRNYFKSLPASLAESAQIDGAGPLYTFIKIILPLSKPILATVGLFMSLLYWNDYVMSLWFIDKSTLYPIQYLLYKILSVMQNFKNFNAIGISSNGIVPTESVMMATFLVTLGPVIFFYPSVQKYFVKGIMIGSIKG